ncbi:MAG TPA: beta-ketoacyl-[acyl-carrier-protein] synthase family protein [Thermoanaerobaculia bacterium]|nr:beta-ketoacyl-[acyl-carrier-protein] synthase family protein [Thermoanaerobaculia bacterium]
MRRRVAVTGLGLVCCLGRSLPAVVGRLRRGESGIRSLPEWVELGLEARVAGRVEGVTAGERPAEIPKRLYSAMSEAAVYCSLAALDAVADARLPQELLASPRTACLVGSGIGSTGVLRQATEAVALGQARRLPPATVLRAMASSASAAVVQLLGIAGRSYSLSSACATSAHTVGHAFELIREGAADVAVAGGGEEINELVAVSFAALRLALASRFQDEPGRASRPFDADRDGFVLAEGGVILVLEEMEAALARGARVRAEIVGFGANTDPTDLVLPDPDGRPAAACMDAALEDARLAPADVDYVNAHATGTRHGDAAEVAALRRVFGPRLPAVSATKSATGHALGASGALELALCIAMLEGGFIAPSLNVDHLDPAFADLPVVTRPTDRPLEHILSNSFGFGGPNACLVLRRFAG